jgi:hypothetical protein
VELSRRVAAIDTLPIRRVTWRPAYRIVPERFPPIDLFERVADPADWDAIITVESLTNDRLRTEIGELSLVAPEDRVSGAGASYIMAPFTHPSPAGGRFTDGTVGAYYAARAEDTAIAETRYHRERFLRATQLPSLELPMRVLTATLDGRLHDLRGLRSQLPEVYDPDTYAASQRLAAVLRARRSWGVAYDSVRDPAGQCTAAFRPPVLSHCRQTRHLAYRWDGARITHVLEQRLRV